MSEINLLSKDKSGSFGRRFLGVLRAASTVSLFLVVFSSISLFALKIFSPLPDLKKQENNLITTLSLSKKQIGTLLLIHDRLTLISALQKSRPYFDTTIDTIIQKLPQDVSIDSMTIDKKKVSVLASSSSLSSLNTFLSGLTVLSSSKTFQTTTLDNITVDEKTGRYISSIELTEK